MLRPFKVNLSLEGVVYVGFRNADQRAANKTQMVSSRTWEENWPGRICNWQLRIQYTEAAAPSKWSGGFFTFITDYLPSVSILLTYACGNYKDK